MKNGTLVCPKCNVILNPLTYQGVTIDKCPKCSGVWLDSGEEIFVTEILRRINKKSCGDCFHLIDNKKCKLLKIFVTSDFHCSNHVSK